MPNLDPKAVFWLSVIVALAHAGATGSVWAGAIPAAAIPYVVAWNGIITTFGQVVLTILLGQNMTVQGRIANVASLPQVAKIVTTEEVASAAPSDKVVPPPK